MSKFTERSEVYFIVFRRKTIRHMQSMCSLPQELAGYPDRREGIQLVIVIPIPRVTVFGIGSRRSTVW